MKVSKRNSQKFVKIILLTAMLVNTGCEEPADGEIPYKQEPISWPSLGNGQASMLLGGPLLNGLYFDEGPTKGDLVWRDSAQYSGAGLAIDGYGNMCGTSFMPPNIVSRNAEGDTLWSVDLFNIFSTFGYPTQNPVLAADGNMYLTLHANFLSISPEGEVIAQVPLKDLDDNWTMNIDKDGNLYSVYRNGTLFSFTPEGELRWELKPPDSLEKKFSSYSWRSPVINPTGDALYVSSDYHLFKISLAGNIIWYRETEYYSALLMTNTEDIIFYTEDTDSIYSVSKDNEMNWVVSTEGANLAMASRGTITPGGVVVLPGNGGFLYALDGYNGEHLWTLTLPAMASQDLICDKNGNVYFHDFTGVVHCINDAGEEVWKVDIGTWLHSGLQIYQGKLYFVTKNYPYHGGLYVIE